MAKRSTVDPFERRKALLAKQMLHEQRLRKALAEVSATARKLDARMRFGIGDWMLATNLVHVASEYPTYLRKLGQENEAVTAQKWMEEYRSKGLAQSKQPKAQGN